MTNKLKITSTGNSTGVILPGEVLDKPRFSKGDSLFAVETSRGIELTPYNPEVDEQMKLAERVMKEDREVLRKLAE